MCGHATISLCRFLVDAGLLSPRDPGIFKFTLQVPCGPVKCSVHVEWNQRLKRYTSIPTKKSTYLSVPSFAVETDVKIGMMNDLQGNLLTTPLTIDLSYGGAFYAFVNMDTQFGVKSLSSTSSTDLLDWARKTLATLRSNYGRELVSKIRHPSQNADLCYLYGLIMVSHDPLEKLSNDEVTQICVFADGQVDRSPCGSGVQAHLALLYKKHPDHFCNLDSCPSFKFTSIIGTQFQGRIHESVAGYFEGDNAVIVEVSGQGFYSGCNSFIKESQDHVVGDGFLLPK